MMIAIDAGTTAIPEATNTGCVSRPERARSTSTQSATADPLSAHQMAPPPLNDHQKRRRRPSGDAVAASHARSSVGDARTKVATVRIAITAQNRVHDSAKMPDIDEASTSASA